jgi:hypothetical protein
MRQAQKNYFRASKSKAKKASSDAKQFLKDSKQLEGEVDKIIAKTYETLNKQSNHEQ